MARVPYVNQSDLPDGYRELLSRPANVFRALANSPDLLRAYLQFGMWIRSECELDPRVRELAILQVGYLAGSEYEFSHHVKIGHDFGVSDDDINALIADNAGRPHQLGELERLVLTATREITEDGNVTDETWEALSGHLEVARLVELVMVVTFYGCITRILSILRIDVEPEYAGYLKTFPLNQSSKS